jgi:hypothetical protein
MEGIIVDPDIFTSFAAWIGGAIVLVLVVAGIFFGYMADEERRGRRLPWAEWPLPGTEEPATPEGAERRPETRKAA